MSAVQSEVAGRADAGRAGLDPFGLDDRVRTRVLPAFRFLHDRYWRVEVSGTANVPLRGPVLLVANHSGAIPFDGAMIITAVEKHRHRAVRFLYDRFVGNLPPVDGFYRKVGGVPATRDNASLVLGLGEPLLVFPEGVSGVAKTFTERYRLRQFSAGFAHLALAHDVPVVPVAVVGAEEIYPVVWRAEGVGKALGVPYVPLTPFFPTFGLLGALPLPTKWFIRFGRALRLRTAEDGAVAERVQAEAGRVRRRIQTMLTQLTTRRKSVFFG